MYVGRYYMGIGHYRYMARYTVLVVGHYSLAGVRELVGSYLDFGVIVSATSKKFVSSSQSI